MIVKDVINSQSWDKQTSLMERPTLEPACMRGYASFQYNVVLFTTMLDLQRLHVVILTSDSLICKSSLELN